jgi:hypothetical protein
MTGGPFTPNDEDGPLLPQHGTANAESGPLGLPSAARSSLGIATTFRTELSGAQATKDRSLPFAVAQKMRMLILRRLYAKSPPAQSREGHRAACCALIGLATLLRSWLCAGERASMLFSSIGGDRPAGHGEICAWSESAHKCPGLNIRICRTAPCAKRRVTAL